MNAPLPDRLSVNPRRPHYNPDVFKREIGIKLNDKEYEGVEKHCIGEGWIAMASGKSLNRKGNPLLMKLKCKIAAFYR